MQQFKGLLISTGILDEKSIQTMSEAVDQEIENAISEADAAPFPSPDSAFTKVYAP